jgi:hypothetical protein
MLTDGMRQKVKAHGITIQAIAKHAETVEDIRRGLRDELAALETMFYWIEHPDQSKGRKP